jgi:hypothetical protein
MRVFRTRISDIDARETETSDFSQRHLCLYKLYIRMRSSSERFDGLNVTQILSVSLSDRINSFRSM